MKKLKKYQRVEFFLDELSQREDSSLNDLETLKSKDIAGAKELEGIGDRTISNCISIFQKKHGINPKKNARTKKKIIEDYLNKKIESEALSKERLMELNYTDLINVSELKGVGKTTLISTLSHYKKKYKKQLFEESMIGFLKKEKAEKEDTGGEKELTSGLKAYSPRNSSLHKADSIFDKDEVILLREMIRKFEQNQSLFEDNSNFELLELKSALSHVGINPKKLVTLYEKTVTRQMIPSSIIASHVKSNTYSTAI